MRKQVKHKRKLTTVYFCCRRRLCVHVHIRYLFRYSRLFQQLLSFQLPSEMLQHTVHVICLRTLFGVPRRLRYECWPIHNLRTKGAKTVSFIACTLLCRTRHVGRKRAPVKRSTPRIPSKRHQHGQSSIKQQVSPSFVPLNTRPRWRTRKEQTTKRRGSLVETVPTTPRSATFLKRRAPRVSMIYQKGVFKRPPAGGEVVCSYLLWTPLPRGSKAACVPKSQISTPTYSCG